MFSQEVARTDCIKRQSPTQPPLTLPLVRVKLRLAVHLDHLPGSFFGPSNLVDLLRHRAAHQPNDVAFCYLVDGETESESWTYAELDRRARAIASWLESLGLQGQRALLLYPAGLEFVAGFFGCVYA